MKKHVSEAVAEMYIKEYFKNEYRISEDMQPNFWEAVKKLAVDINTDVTNLIDEENSFCVPEGRRNIFRHISIYDANIKTVTDLAKKIAKKIIDSENKTVNPVEVFLLEKRIEALERKVHYIELGHARFM